MTASRIALVGNGPIDSSAGAAIDAHDMVVRFNRCQHYGATGYRTDALVLVNTGPSARRFANDQAFINPIALASAQSFWIARRPAVNAFEKWRHKVYAKRKPWYFVDAWDDYTDAIVAHRVGSRPWRCIGALTYWHAIRATMARGASALQTPSTGMLALFHIRRHLQPCRVTLFGFTHEGWSGHPWGAERAQVAEWRDWVSYACAQDNRN